MAEQQASSSSGDQDHGLLPVRPLHTNASSSSTMTERPVDNNFGGGNYGAQTGNNYGNITVNNNHLPERDEAPPKSLHMIPYKGGADFVERGDTLKQIKQRLSQPGARVALAGIGGVGKSRLVIEYAHRAAAEQPDTWIFWIHAAKRVRAEAGVSAIANAVRLPGRDQPEANKLQLVHEWLSNEQNGKWLMILDSADELDVFYDASEAAQGKNLAMYLPQTGNGSILVTTRDKVIARRLTGGAENIIEIGPMSEPDALLLLEKKLEPLSDRETALELVQALDYIPLAINQAAGYIQAHKPRTSLAKYLRYFEKGERKKTRLLKYDGGDLRRDASASNAVLTTWQISFEDIRSKRTSAADLLSLMSFFDRQGIPESLLKHSGYVREQHAEREDRETEEEQVSESASNTNGTDDEFEDDVKMLMDYCLITTKEDENEFEMHRLVQLSTRTWLEAVKRQEEFKQKFIVQMAASFPKGSYENWETCQRLFAHVEVAAVYQPAGDKAQDDWATLLYNGGWYAWEQGRYETAERMIRASMESREERLGKEDNASVKSASLLGSVLLDQGRLEDAEKLQVQVMETTKKKLGMDHPNTLTSMGNLAGTWKLQGRDGEALALLKDCAQARQRIIGPEHPQTLATLETIKRWS